MYKVSVSVPGYTSEHEVTATVDEGVLHISGYKDVPADCAAGKTAEVSECNTCKHDCST